MSKSSTTPSASSSSKSLNSKKKQLTHKAKLRQANVLKPSQSVYKSKRSLIEAEIDRFPFDFKHKNKRQRSRMTSSDDNNDDRYSGKGSHKRTVRNIRIATDDDIYVMADIFQYQQLPDMTDFSEGCSGFFFTALAVSILISVSFLIVFSIDIITDSFLGIKKAIQFEFNI